MGINKQAWAVLTEDEKLALNLQYGHSKSSWQSGEVMGKSHYKYLEIKYRAEKFLKMFTEHFETFDFIVSPFNTGDIYIKEYFELAITKRLKISQIAKILNDKYSYTGKRTRDSEIVIQMDKWMNSDNAYDSNLYNLIKEFDRWNNFRILPIDIREPSAFKRRNSKEHKKNIKLVASVPTLSVPLIKKLFKHRKSDTAPLFLPFMTDENLCHIIQVNNSPKVIEEINKIPFYVFTEKSQAKAYTDILKSYLNLQYKGCRDGLEFWPKYRDIIKVAHNYSEIQRIIPSRKYLELALSKLKFI